MSQARGEMAIENFKKNWQDFQNPIVKKLEEFNAVIDAYEKEAYHLVLQTQIIEVADHKNILNEFLKYVKNVTEWLKQLRQLNQNYGKKTANNNLPIFFRKMDQEIADLRTEIENFIHRFGLMVAGRNLNNCLIEKNHEKQKEYISIASSYIKSAKEREREAFKIQSGWVERQLCTEALTDYYYNSFFLLDTKHKHIHEILNSARQLDGSAAVKKYDEAIQQIEVSNFSLMMMVHFEQGTCYHKEVKEIIKKGSEQIKNEQDAQEILALFEKLCNPWIKAIELFLKYDNYDLLILFNLQAAAHEIYAMTSYLLAASELIKSKSKLVSQSILFAAQKYDEIILKGLNHLKKAKLDYHQTSGAFKKEGSYSIADVLKNDKNYQQLNALAIKLNGQINLALNRNKQQEQKLTYGKVEVTIQAQNSDQSSMNYVVTWITEWRKIRKDIEDNIAKDAISIVKLHTNNIVQAKKGDIILGVKDKNQKKFQQETLNKIIDNKKLSMEKLKDLEVFATNPHVSLIFNDKKQDAIKQEIEVALGKLSSLGAEISWVQAEQYYYAFLDEKDLSQKKIYISKAKDLVKKAKFYLAFQHQADEWLRSELNSLPEHAVYEESINFYADSFLQTDAENKSIHEKLNVARETLLTDAGAAFERFGQIAKQIDKNNFMLKFHVLLEQIDSSKEKLIVITRQTAPHDIDIAKIKEYQSLFEKIFYAASQIQEIASAHQHTGKKVIFSSNFFLISNMFYDLANYLVKILPVIHHDIELAKAVLADARKYTNFCIKVCDYFNVTTLNSAIVELTSKLEDEEKFIQEKEHEYVAKQMNPEDIEKIRQQLEQEEKQKKEKEIKKLEEEARKNKEKREKAEQIRLEKQKNSANTNSSLKNQRGNIPREKSQQQQDNELLQKVFDLHSTKKYKEAIQLCQDSLPHPLQDANTLTHFKLIYSIAECNNSLFNAQDNASSQYQKDATHYMKLAYRGLSDGARSLDLSASERYEWRTWFQLASNSLSPPPSKNNVAATTKKNNVHRKKGTYKKTNKRIFAAKPTSMSPALIQQSLLGAEPKLQQPVQFLPEAEPIKSHKIASPEVEPIKLQQPIQFSPEVSPVIQRLLDTDISFDIVGGFTRDLLLGKNAKDVDIAVDRSPNEMKEILQLEGQIYGVTRPILKLKESNIEMTPLMMSASSSLPVTQQVVELDNGMYVSYTPATSKAKDAETRDFTVNSLYLNLRTNEIDDPTGFGLSDLEQKLIRTNIDPDVSFQQDPIRMLRAIRQSIALDFTIEPDTYNAICRNGAELKKYPERCLLELEKMLADGNISKSLQKLKECGLLKHLFPEADQQMRVGNSITNNLIKSMLDNQPIPLALFLAVMLWQPIQKRILTAAFSPGKDLGPWVTETIEHTLKNYENKLGLTSELQTKIHLMWSRYLSKTYQFEDSFLKGTPYTEEDVGLMDNFYKLLEPINAVAKTTQILSQQFNPKPMIQAPVTQEQYLTELSQKIG